MAGTGQKRIKVKIVVYAKPIEGTAERQLKAIFVHVPQPIHIVASCAALKEALAECFSGETIVVYFVTSTSDLTYLDTLESKLLDIKLLLNLVRPENRLLLRAYKLHPRFITMPHDPPELLAKTINGIIREMKRR